MNKKGNAIVDTITVIVVLFAFATTIVLGLHVFGEFNDTIQDNDFFGNESKNISQNQKDNYPELMDNLFFMGFILLVLFVMVASFMVDTHPAFFIFAVIMMAAVFVVAFFIANGYEDIMETDTLSDDANQFNKIGWIMTHLLEISIGMAFMVTIILFIRYRQGGT